MDKSNNPLDKITPFLKERRKITKMTDYEIKEIDAKELLTFERIDLVAKLKMIEKIDKNLNYNWPLEVYQNTLSTMCFGKCSEPGNEEKNNIDDYIKILKDLMNSISTKGFNEKKSLVPINENNLILDGAHRVAVSMYYNNSVKAIKFQNQIVDYSPFWFRDKNLLEHYIDYLVLEYCKIKPNTYVFCLWPRADSNKREDAIKLINKKVKVFYDKEINLNYNGYRNFMLQVYGHHTEWIGTYKNHFKGVYSQLDSCYKPGEKLKIFVVESNDPTTIVNLKKEIRDIFNVGNFSIHSTDNQAETVQMLELLLNDNSIFFMNNGAPDYYVKLNKKLMKLKEKIINNGLNINNIVVESSSVLGLFGLREPNDIDYISLDDEFSIVDDEETENHESVLKYYDTTKEDLIFNPDNYFIYQGIKFVTLDKIRKMKENRGEKKDLIDADLIKNFLNKNGYHWKQQLKKTQYWYLKTKRKLKISISKILKKLGLLPFVLNIYHRMLKK